MSHCSSDSSQHRRYVKLWSDVKEQVTANNSDPPEGKPL